MISKVHNFDDKEISIIDSVQLLNGNHNDEVSRAIIPATATPKMSRPQSLHKSRTIRELENIEDFNKRLLSQKYEVSTQMPELPLSWCGRFITRITQSFDRLDQTLNAPMTIVLRTSIQKIIIFFFIVPTIYADHVTSILSGIQLAWNAQYDFSALTFILYFLNLFFRSWSLYNHAKIKEIKIEIKEVVFKTIFLVDLVEGQYRIAFLNETDQAISLGVSQSEITAIFDSIPNILLTLYSQCYSTYISGIVLASSFTSMLTLARTISNNCVDPYFQLKPYSDNSEKKLVDKISEILITFMEMIAKIFILVVFSYSTRPNGLWIYLGSMWVIYFLWLSFGDKLPNLKQGRKRLGSVFKEFIRGIVPVCLHSKVSNFYHFGAKYSSLSSLMKIDTARLMIARIVQIIVLITLMIVSSVMYVNLETFYPKLLFILAVISSNFIMGKYALDLYFISKTQNEFKINDWKTYLINNKDFEDYINTKPELLSSIDSKLRHAVAQKIKYNGRKVIAYISGLLKTSLNISERSEKLAEKNIQKIVNSFGVFQYAQVKLLLRKYIGDVDINTIDWQLQFQQNRYLNSQRKLDEFQRAISKIILTKDLVIIEEVQKILQLNSNKVKFSNIEENIIAQAETLGEFNGQFGPEQYNLTLDLLSQMIPNFEQNEFDYFLHFERIYHDDLIEYQNQKPNLSYQFMFENEIKIQRIIDEWNIHKDKRLCEYGFYKMAQQSLICYPESTLECDYLSLEPTIAKLVSMHCETNLEVIRIRNFPKYNDSLFTPILRNNKRNLTELSLLFIGNDFSDESLEYLSRTIMQCFSKVVEGKNKEFKLAPLKKFEFGIELLSASGSITNEGYLDILRSITFLKDNSELKQLSLNFSGWNCFDDSSFIELARNIAQLENISLNISKCQAITNSAFEEFFYQLNLEVKAIELKLADCPLISENFLRYFSKSKIGSNLVGLVLDISGITQISDHGLNELKSCLSKFSLLEEIFLQIRENKSICKQNWNQFIEKLVMLPRVKFIFQNKIDNILIGQHKIEQYISRITDRAMNSTITFGPFYQDISGEELKKIGEHICPLIERIGIKTTDIEVDFPTCRYHEQQMEMLGKYLIAPITKNIINFVANFPSNSYFSNSFSQEIMSQLNSSLRYFKLNLSGTIFNEQFIQQFADMIPNYNLLNCLHLNLANSGLKEQGLKYLSSSIGRLKNINDLDINIKGFSGNTEAIIELGNCGLAPLVQSLKHLKLGFSQVKMLSDEAILKFSDCFLKDFNDLKTFNIDLGYCQNLTTSALDTIILKIVSSLDTMENFGLNTTNIGLMKGIDLGKWTGMGMKNILSNLKILDLHILNSITTNQYDQFLELLGESMDKVEEVKLNLSSCGFSNEAKSGIREYFFSPRFKNLKHLELKIGSSYRNTKLEGFVKKDQRFEYIWYSNQNIFATNKIHYWAQFCNENKWNESLIKICNQKSSFSLSPVIQNFYELSKTIQFISLHLSGTNLDDEDMSKLNDSWKQCIALVFLEMNLSSCIQLTNKALYGLTNLKYGKLKHLFLNISDCLNIQNISSLGRTLTELVHLKQYFIENTRKTLSLTQENLDKDQEYWKQIQSNNKFECHLRTESLLVGFEQFNEQIDLIQEHLGRSRILYLYTRRDFRNYNDLSEKVLVHLAPNLESLHLNFADCNNTFNQGHIQIIIEKGIHRMSHITNLKLEFRNNKAITDSAIESISKLGNLKSLQTIFLDFGNCNFGDAGLNQVGNCLAQLGGSLKSLDLNLENSYSIRESGFVELAGGLGQLLILEYLKLDFENCFCVNDAAILEIGKSLGKIHQDLKALQINFNSCYNITDAGLCYLAEFGISSLRNLESLKVDFSNILGITDQGLVTFTDSGILPNAKQIKRIEIRLENCYNIGDRGINHFGARTKTEMSSLEEFYINLEGCVSLVNLEVITLLSIISGNLKIFEANLKRCEKISLYVLSILEYCELESPKGLQKFTLLFDQQEHLSGYIRALSNPILPVLAPGLESLNLQFTCSPFQANDLKVFLFKGLASCSEKLKSLNLNLQNLNNDTLFGILARDSFKQINKLEELRLNFGSSSKITDATMKELIFSMIIQFKKTLKCLEFNLTQDNLPINNGFTDLMIELHNFHYLETVNLNLCQSGVESINSIILGPLNGVLKILKFNLKKVVLTDSGLQSLAIEIGKLNASLSVLQLNCQFCKVTDEGAITLFENVGLLGGNLQYLDIDFGYCNIIGDRSLKAFNRKCLANINKNLNHLQLDCTSWNITNEGLQEFGDRQGWQGCVSLRELKLIFASILKINEQGINNLMSALQSLNYNLECVDLNFSDCVLIRDVSSITRQSYIPINFNKSILHTLVLNLNGCGITNHSVGELSRAIQKCGSSLRHLDLKLSYNPFKVDEQEVELLALIGLGSVAGKLSYLSLDFFGWKISDFGICQLSPYLGSLGGTLKSFCMRFGLSESLTDVGLEGMAKSAISKFKHIDTLKITFSLCPQVTKIGFRFLIEGLLNAKYVTKAQISLDNCGTEKDDPEINDIIQLTNSLKFLSKKCFFVYKNPTSPQGLDYAPAGVIQNNYMINEKQIQNEKQNQKDITQVNECISSDVEIRDNNDMTIKSRDTDIFRSRNEGIGQAMIEVANDIIEAKKDKESVNESIQHNQPEYT